MKLSNKAYDLLKLLAVIILPLSELVGSLSTIWGLPHGQEIVATLAALHVFLGAIVTNSSAAYKKEKEQ